MKQYDVIVIGSGGGAKIAVPAARRGLRTAFIEKGACGGTCLNRGCIPSKMLVYPAECARQARAAERLLVDRTAGARVRFPELMARIAREVDEKSQSLRAGYEQTQDLDYYPAAAAFVADHVLRVGGELLTAPRIFLAVGSEPRIPEIAGLAGTPYMTNEEALRRQTLPERLVVVGGGFIAAELGHAYACCGADVAFIVRSRFLREEDPEITAAFNRLFGRQHTVHAGFVPDRVSYANGVFAVRCSDLAGRTRTVEGDALLMATGVRPAVAGLGLEHTGVRTDARGFIQVNDRLETDVPGVYAFGDVIGRFAYRHAVNFEGEYLVRTAFGEEAAAPIAYGPVPHAVFTEPEVAGVGLTEAQARHAGVAYVVGRGAYAEATPGGMIRRVEDGFVKLIAEAPSGRLLGAHIIGLDAASLLHTCIAFLKTGGRLADMREMIFIHPALPEVVRDAVRDACAALAQGAGTGACLP